MTITLQFDPHAARHVAKALRNEADRLRGYKSGAGAEDLNAAADAIEAQVHESEHRVAPFRGKRVENEDRPSPRKMTRQDST